MSNPSERDAKEILATFQGSDFVDAIYEGTTENTATGEFRAALHELALESANGRLDVGSAAAILKRHNPGNSYNVGTFVDLAGKAIAKHKAEKAGPDLLDALQEIDKIMYHYLDEVHPTMVKIRAAIAKAKGS